MSVHGGRPNGENATVALRPNKPYIGRPYVSNVRPIRRLVVAISLRMIVQHAAQNVEQISRLAHQISSISSELSVQGLTLVSPLAIFDLETTGTAQSETESSRLANLEGFSW